MMRSATDQVALLALESTYGVAPVITAANAILIMGAKIAPAADKLTRAIDRPYMGGDPFVLIGKRIVLTGEVDIIGSATPGDASPVGTMYRVCGHSETLDDGVDATYAPISTGFASGTIDFFWAGVKFRMTGARGYLDQDYSIKGYAKATINVTGVLTMPADGEAPVGIDWSTFQTPRAIESGSWEVKVGASNVCAQQLTLAAGATVNLVECSEGKEVMITARKPNGTLRVFKDATLATWNPWAIAEAQNIIVITNTITGGAGKNVLQTIRAQLQYPTAENIDGLAGFAIPFDVIPDEGNDEYELVFS